MDEIKSFKKWIIIIAIEVILLGAGISTIVVLRCKRAEEMKLGYDIPADNALVEYKDTNKLVADLNEKTGRTRFLLLSRPTCDWCCQYVPYINDYATKNNIEIWYFNPEQYRGATVYKDGSYSYNHVEYKMVVDFIRQTEGAITNGLIRYNVIGSSEDSNVSARVPWLYVPSLYKVVDGVTLEKLQTVPGHEKVDGVLPPMTEVQEEILVNNIEKFLTE